MANSAFQTDEKAAEILRRLGAAQQTRGTFESHWEEIAQRVLPSYVGSFTSGTAAGSRTQGAKNTTEMVDATAALALPKFAAAMESMLTPRNQVWQRLRPIDKVLRRNRAAMMWYQDVNEILFRYRYAPAANFASQQHEIYMGLGAFGTSAMFVDALQKPYGPGLRYRACHLAECFFFENHQGIIDTNIRRFSLTGRQVLQKTRLPEGEAWTLPEDIKAKLDGDPKALDMDFWFVHFVGPREDYEPGRLDYRGMMFESCYVSETGKAVVLEKGYSTFPYPISRYVVAPGETYGRSPAMLALPAIKTLNEEKKTILKQGHRAVDPVLLAHDDGVLSGFSLKPGAINYGGVSADGRPLVHPLATGNLAVGDKMMEIERHVINDAFLITLFQILIETPQMTATEVLERAREKGALLSPTMGRQESESLGPLTERELDVLAQQNLLPPMPPIVAQARAEYESIYDSPLSRAQRAEQGAGLFRLVDWQRDYISVTGDPSGLDWVDMDAAMPELADIQAVPARWMRSPEGVAAVRQKRAQAQQTQQMIDAAPAVAGVAKAMPQLGGRR